MFLFLLASGPAEIEIQFELGSNLQFKLSRQKMCVSMVENVDKKSNHRSGSNISSHVVFIYSLLIAFILAVLLGIFVTLMQKKYEAQLAKNDIVQSKPAAGKEVFRTCNVLPFSCTHLALWRGKEEGLKLWLFIWEERKLDFTKGVSLFQLKSM